MASSERKKVMIGIGGFLAVGGCMALLEKGPQALTPAPGATAANSITVPAPSAEEQKAAQKLAAAVASGDHCLSGWDGSFPRLKEAVKLELRNPRSFEHVETVRSPVDAKGTFGLIMTYRAENGFGGMNVEAIGVEVNAKTCSFKRASEAALAKRLHSRES